MAFLSSMSIVGSGLTAQQIRLDVISENVTSMHTARTENGGPYRRKMVVFEEQGGRQTFQEALARAAGRTLTPNNNEGGVRVTQIIEDTSDFKQIYDPTHPDADENGYVLLPNVDLVKETVDAMAAQQAYTANVTVFNAIKGMATSALEIGKG